MFFNYSLFAHYVLQHAGTTLTLQEVCMGCCTPGAEALRHVHYRCAHVHSKTWKTLRLLGFP